MVSPNSLQNIIKDIEVCNDMRVSKLWDFFPGWGGGYPYKWILGVFDLKQRCAEWSVYDIKVPREREQTGPGAF